MVETGSYITSLIHVRFNPDNLCIYTIALCYRVGPTCNVTKPVPLKVIKFCIKKVGYTCVLPGPVHMCTYGLERRDYVSFMDRIILKMTKMDQ